MVGCKIIPNFQQLTRKSSGGTTYLRTSSSQVEHTAYKYKFSSISLRTSINPSGEFSARPGHKSISSVAGSRGGAERGQDEGHVTGGAKQSKLGRKPET